MVFLPSYAPNLHLIEKLWTFFKNSFLRKRCYTANIPVVLEAQSFTPCPFHPVAMLNFVQKAYYYSSFTSL